MGKRGFSDDPIELINSGISHFIKFLQLQPREDDLVQWGEANENIGDAQLLLVNVNIDAAPRAKGRFQEALSAYAAADSIYHYDKCKAKLDSII